MANTDSARVSIVLPVFEPPEGTERSLLDFHDRIERELGDVEMVVVDDGSRVRPVAAGLGDRPRLRLLRLPVNGGKGEALRRGMAITSGRYRVFLDGDLPYDLESLRRVVDALRAGADIAIGDRTLDGSGAVGSVGWRRAALSRLVSIFVALPLTGGLPDTQCGLKGFQADVADRLFPMSGCRRFLIDVELLHAARREGLVIERVPVHQTRLAPSTIRFWREMVPTAVDLAGLLKRSLVRRLGRG